MLSPISEKEFNQLAQQGYNRIPLVAETFADLDTPLSLYLKLANKPYSYLLESVQGGERFGRYSFIGLPASTRITVRGHQVTLTQPSGETTEEAGNPLEPVIEKMNALAKDYHDKSRPAYCAKMGLVDEIVSFGGIRSYLVAFADCVYQNPKSICPQHQMILPRIIKG